MLERLALRDFTPSEGSPLVISLVEWVKSRGFSVEIGWDTWDFLVYDHEDTPVMVIKAVKNRVPKDLLSRILVEKAPYKVILLEGDNPSIPDLNQKRIWLAANGAGTYIRDVGWATLPASVVHTDVQDLRLRLAKRWSEGKDGIWRKKCVKCHQFKTTDEFYASASPTAKDPYRNECKECVSFAAKLSYAAKKGRQRKAWAAYGE